MLIIKYSIILQQQYRSRLQMAKLDLPELVAVAPSGKLRSIKTSNILIIREKQ